MKKPKYDSNFEKELHQKGLKACNHHPKRITYTIEREYEPDFQYGKTLIEAKGRFRDRLESSKYLHIRDSLATGYRLVFVFMNHKTPMPGSKRRKDGTRLSMGEWATINKFKWYTPQTLPPSWGKKK